MKNEQITIQIPDNLKVSFTAKEVGEIRDYLANTFTHAQVDNVIQFLSGRMIQSYQAVSTEEDPKPIGGGGGGGAPKPLIEPTPTIPPNTGE